MRWLAAVAVLGAVRVALAAPAVLERVEVGGDGTTVIRLRVAAPKEPVTRLLQADGDHPARLVVDLGDVLLGRSAPRLVAGDARGPLLRIRTGQFTADTTRIVLDLAAPVPAMVRRDGGTVTIALASGAPPRIVPTRELPADLVVAAPRPLPRGGASAAAGASAIVVAGLPAGPDPAPVPPGPPPRPPVGGATAAAGECAIVAGWLPARPDPAPPRFPWPAPLAEGGASGVASETALVVAGLPVGPEPAPRRFPWPAPLSEGGVTAAYEADELVVAGLPREPVIWGGDPLTRAGGATAGAAASALVLADRARDPDPAPVAADATTSEPVAVAMARRPPAPTGAAAPEPPTPAFPFGFAAPTVPGPVPSLPAAMVMVDAGHGGRDPGAAGLGGLVEKDVALVVAAGLAAKLAARLPVTAVLTRWDDSFVPLGERLPAPDGPATVFVSLHANASRDASAHGIEVFFGGDLLRASGSDGAPSPRAQRLGQTIAHALGTTGARVRGVARPGRFAVLRHNPAPGVLVELGYLTNAGDAALLQDPARLEALTDALVDGVARFLRAGV